MASLFLAQGFSASSSEKPFDDYLSQGIGSKPMVMIYEAQFLGEQMNADTKSAITPDMVLMYPSPNVLSKHTVVPLTKNGDAVGQLLSNDPTLAKLAAQYGFRPADPSVFTSVLKAHSIKVLRRSLSGEASRLDGDAEGEVTKILQSLDDIVARWPDLAGAPDQQHTVEQMIGDYLPTSLQGYLNLPRTYALSARVAGRKTAHDELMDQLNILDTEGARIRDAVYSREVEALSDQSRFLRQKFARSSLDIGDGTPSDDPSSDGPSSADDAPPQPAELEVPEAPQPPDADQPPPPPPSARKKS
jgi:hypothetical protein